MQDKLVARIAIELNFPESFFYQPEERLGFGSSSYFYRKKAQISAVDRKRITGIVNLIRINLKRFLSAVEIESKRELPALDLEEYGCAEHAVMALRSFWSLPDGPIKNVTSLIESAGVLVIPCDFGTKAMDATSLRLTDMPPMIFINRYIPGDRWRFTLSHELAHLVIHDIPSETMENEADAFASEFLMPEIEMNALFKRIGRIRLQDLASLKPYWKVSMAALLMRAKSLGFVSNNGNRYLWSQIAKMGYKKVEPNPIEREKTHNDPNLFSYYKEELGFSVEEMARSVFIHPQEFVSLHVEGVWPYPEIPYLRVVR